MLIEKRGLENKYFVSKDKWYIKTEKNKKKQIRITSIEKGEFHRNMKDNSHKHQISQKNGSKCESKYF